MLFEPLFAHAQQQPDDTAIIDDRGRYSYNQLAAMAAGLGLLFRMQIDRPKVGLLLPAGAGFVASFYGTLLAGKAVVPINFLLGDKEIAHVIQDSEIDTIVTAPPLSARLKDLPIKSIDLTQLPQSPPPGLKPTFPDTNADDLAVLMYTSGTSGLPKGVLLSFGNLQSDIDASIGAAALQTRHRFLGVIPLFHAFGMTAMMLAPIQLGSTIVYMARFSPAGALGAIREHGISLMFGVPSMYAAMGRLKDAKPEDFSRMYAMMAGGEPLPSAVRESFMQRFGVMLFEGYGLTETSPVISLNTPQAHKAGSVGKPLPGVEVKIVADDGSAAPAEEDGEIWLRGPMIFQGYNNLPKETAEALTSDRFFKTGDYGKINSDGYLYITGRKKDLIIIAGEKAVPREIEEALASHPDVAEAAVLGKRDPSRGEVVAAFVIPREGASPSADSLREHCRDRGLPQWKIPREIRFVPDFPRSPTGKVLKRVLAEQLSLS
jgi:long-chain acyl-CoA synthetase